MKLIVGLGNPGKKYAATRHNIGFRVVDQLVSSSGSSFTDMPRFKGEIAELRQGVERSFVLKPQTFMNLSGESVLAAAQFYKIPVSDVIAVYDDLDLPPGRLRIATKGGSGGHNGVKSLIQHLGTEEFPRLKIGIGRPIHPGEQVVDYVLHPFLPEHLPAVDDAVARAVEALRMILAGDALDLVMTRFNKK